MFDFFNAQTSHSEMSQMTTTTLRRSKCSIINWFIFILPCPLLAIALNVPLPELLDFLPQEKWQIPRAAAFPKPGNLLWISFTGKSRNRDNQLKISNRKTRCEDFPVGKLLKISVGFPMDFLAGKPKNTGSVLLSVIQK